MHTLTFLLLVVLCLQGQVLEAQVAVEQSFRTLGVRRAAPKLFYQLGSKEVPLFAGDAALSASYQAPKSGKLELYCYVPATDPELPPVKVTVAEATLPSEGENLVLIASIQNTNSKQAAPAVALRAVDASIEAHPLNTIRVFNFSKRKIAAKVGDEFKEILVGEEAFFAYPEGNKVWVKIAAYEGVDTGWKLRTGGPKAISPDKRTIIVLSDAYPTREDPEGLKITLRNVIDNNPPRPLSER
ncbi:hypothetical protein QEH52_15235 [Coraliomargarita sp. SDUM461003]|uniref:Uncharacterized protein n=1 Tax=Thalassobacterium maritimum TaxID=3041265 RepID=A0ABU1B0G7_9BACT|nr:hypothetical protein [Coraliomargarita sp. SDUM461003]MDQ8208880.1 hypothetical protein [Coraliomargarita sp. SDUM461003]